MSPEQEREESRGRHPFVEGLDAVAADVPAEAALELLRVAGKALNAAGEAFESGVGMAGEGLGNPAGAAVDVAGSVDWGGVASVAGDAAGVAAEGLVDVAASYGETAGHAPPDAGPGGVALIDIRDGREVWRFKTDSYAFPAALSPNRVVFGTANGAILGLDRATGREVWRRDFPGVPFEVVTAGPVVVVADADPESAGPGGLVDKSRMGGRVWALDPDSGDTHWETQVGDFSVFVDFGSDTIVLASETGRGNNEIVAIRPATGERIWRVAAGSSFGRPLVVESSVIVPGSRLASMDLGTAFLEWAVAPENGGTFFFPTRFGENVASMTNTGTFEVRGMSDGKLVGAPMIGDCSGEPVVVGTRLFVLACGALRAWDPASSGLLDYLTPQGRIQTVATARGLLFWSSGTGHSGVKVAALRP